MRKLLFVFFGFLFILTSAFSQKEVKYFYDSAWKGCNLENAKYYRIFKIDPNGKPIGEIKDYYISGELQSTVERASYIDKDDDSKSLTHGKSTGYYKSGKIEFQNLSDYNSKLIKSLFYHENGNKKHSQVKSNDVVSDTFFYVNGKIKGTATYVDHKLEGITNVYDENGILREIRNYHKGLLSGKYISYNAKGQIETQGSYSNDIEDPIHTFYDYDSLSRMYNKFVGSFRDGKFTGKKVMIDNTDSIVEYHENSRKSRWLIQYLNSQKKSELEIFNEDFSKSQNSLDWDFHYLNNSSAKIENNKLNLNIDAKSDVDAILSNSRMNINENNFDVTVGISKDNLPFQYGIIFGFKDWQNHSRVLIIPGYNVIEYVRVEDGITVWSEIDSESLQKTPFYNTINEIRLIKNKSRIKLIIQGKVICEFKDVKIIGNQFGLTAGSFRSSIDVSFEYFNVEIGDVAKTAFDNLNNKNVIPIRNQDGVYFVPVELNEKLKIDFIFDSGASEVSLSPDIALTLIKTGTLELKDWLPGKRFSFADGSSAISERFMLRSLKIGAVIIKNVACAISNSIHAPMLLGQSVLKRFGKYTIDNKNLSLTFE